MAGRVEGKVAFITGAARGQGRAHAVRLAEEGADIIAVDACARIESVDKYPSATEEDLAETVAAVEKLGGRILARKADVRDADGLSAALGEGVERFGGLDIVVANAGIASYAMSWELTERMWQDMLDVNLTGVWHTAKAAVPHLVRRGGGSMVFTSSIGGLKGIMQVAHYVSAKHGIVGLMRTMANELAGKHVRVNTVHPTNVDTHMIQNPGTWGMFSDDPEPTQEKAMAGFMSLNALEVPWVDPVDIANAVLFLSSDEARYITGVALPVDAGAAVK
ncbi:mycofactocin-coupled SDR family oxidoreductase [Amycolatopsis acidicola]|uniref:Mycofactocin-coupled SDR family oxidoreductase n=1 Tax=Amycolatopsis acidicola TaxID=2596893 RepID=A0A5N0UUA7_9PSEU|nr:mycofactocin-coupled SDR family oxidoreductase [Amycolatopsis acidicola]KAA9155634.1 mycofactocin-coupled SDR family oxidoreductase [Amycolatopsis acidicola]